MKQSASRFMSLVANISLGCCFCFILNTPAVVAFTINSISPFLPPIICSKSNVKGQHSFTRRLATASEDDQDDSSSNQSWLKKAMNNDTSENLQLQSSPSFSNGIAGFAVDPKLGFVAVLAEKYRQTDESVTQRAVYAVVAPSDTVRVSSPEALCMVQLSGGLDLGAGVFPPNALALAAVEETVSNASADEKQALAEKLRSRLTLRRVDVVLNEDYINDLSDNEKDSVTSPSAIRRKKIDETSEKLMNAVKNVPDLADSTINNVIHAMNIHADSDGEIKKDEFIKILETLRKMKNNVKPSKIKFVLSMSELQENGFREIQVSSPIFEALALSMRYKIDIRISEDCLSSFSVANESLDSNNVLKRFPEYRPIEDLRDEARVMDGFIPTQFFKQKNLDNDEKM